MKLQYYFDYFKLDHNEILRIQQDSSISVVQRKKNIKDMIYNAYETIFEKLVSSEEKSLCNYNYSILLYNVAEFLRDVPALSKSRIFIWDFDLTLTRQHTYDNDYYHRSFDKSSIQSNIRSFEQTKKTLAKIRENKHFFSICSFSDLHYSGIKEFNIWVQLGVKKTTIEQSRQGYPLIKKYCEALEASDAIIQAYKTYDENKDLNTAGKIDQFDHLCQVLGSSYDKVIYMDDDLVNVNIALKAGIKSFLVTAENYEFLLSILDAAAENPQYLDVFWETYPLECKEPKYFSEIIENISFQDNLFDRAIKPHFYYMSIDHKLELVKKIIVNPITKLDLFKYMIDNLISVNQFSSWINLNSCLEPFVNNIELARANVEIIRELIFIRKKMISPNDSYQA